MEMSLDAKQLLSRILYGIGLVAGFFAIYGTFDSYVDGWGKHVCIAFALLFVLASSLVKKLPI